jgi:DNA repair protein RadC
MDDLLGLASPECDVLPSAGDALKCSRDGAQRAALEPKSQVLTSGEILQQLLSPLLPEPEAQRTASELLARFGSLGAVLSADALQLTDVVDSAVAEHLQTTHLALQRALREQIEDRPIVGSWSALEDYITIKLRHSSVEKLLVLFLDQRNALIHEECMQQGPFDPTCCRKIARRALELNAHAVILVHNHPSGDAMPSPADVEITKKISAVLGNLDIILHDHAIVGKEEVVSLRAMRRI